MTGGKVPTEYTAPLVVDKLGNVRAGGGQLLGQVNNAGGGQWTVVLQGIRSGGWTSRRSAVAFVHDHLARRWFHDADDPLGFFRVELFMVDDSAGQPKGAGQ